MLEFVRLCKIFSVVLATAFILPAATAADLQKIRQVIAAADILPPAYRRHVNIIESARTMAISAYRDPDAKPVDCKIDAVLLAYKILSTGALSQRVRVVFYDLLEQDKFWQVDVAASTVRAYAAGSIGKQQLLREVLFSVRQQNSLARTYACMPYKQIIDGLGVVNGPARTQRAVALVRIENLQGQGQDTAALKRQYLHLEDLIRRGSLTASGVNQRLATLFIDIDKVATASGRDELLKTLAKDRLSARPVID